MEEVKEKFEKLPESEKVKLLIDLYKHPQRHIDEKYVENQGKKQKTLDGWLIKGNNSSHKNNNVSLCQNKELENVSTSAINNVSKNCSNSNNVSLKNVKDTDSTSSLHSIPNGNDFSKDTENTSNKSEKIKDNSVNDLLIESKKSNLTEKYNLRRSNRKITKLSPINECYEYTARYKKENKNISSSSDSNKDLNFHTMAVGGENEILKSNNELIQLQITETSINQHTLENNAQTQNNSSNVEQMEDEHQNISGASSHSKTSYKLKTTKKRALVKSDIDCSSVIVMNEGENVKLKSNSELIQSQTPKISINQHSSLSNDNAQTQNNSSNVEQMEDEHQNTSTASSHSKTSYKLKTTKKRALVKSDIDCSSVIVMNEGENVKLKSNSELIQSQTPKISINQHSSLSNDNAQTVNNSSSMEDDQYNSSSVSSHSKTSYKLRTTRERALLKSRLDCSDVIIVYEGENEKLKKSNGELAKSQKTEISDNQDCSLSNNTAQKILDQCDLSNVQHIEEIEYENFNNSNVSPHCKTSYKHGTKRKKSFVKPGVDRSSDIIQHEVEIEKLKSNSELIQSQATEIYDNQLSNNTALKILDQCNSNNVQHMEEIEYENFNNSNISSQSKTCYKRRSKRKKPFAKSEIDCCSGIVAYEGLNNHLDAQSQSNEQGTTVSQQTNYEAFCKLNTECSKIGINVMDILGDENIQNLLNDHKKLNNESVVCIGSFKSTLKKTLPVVHLIESKKKLLECISELQKIQ